MSIRSTIRGMREALRNGGSVWDALAVVGIGDGPPIKPQDRPLWAAAQNLEDLGELTAQWLEGRIESQPGYYGPVDVEEDDAPGMTDTLVALNRAGYVTNGSQAGYDGVGCDDAHWVQHAAVTGFAREETVRSLRSPLESAGYAVVTDRRGDAPDGTCVTFRDGQPYTNFGGRVGRRTIAREIYDGVGGAAIEDVCWTPQLTVIDLVPGRNTMWSHLREATDQHLAEAATTPSNQDTNDDTDGA